MNYKGPAHSWEGHPNHLVHAKLMKALHDARYLFEIIKHEPEDLGVAMYELEQIAFELRGYARRLPIHMVKVLQKEAETNAARDGH